MQATVFKHSSHVAIQHGNIQKRRYQTEYTWGASKQNNKILSLRAFWNIPCRKQSGKADASLFLLVSPWTRWLPYSAVCIHHTVCHRRTTSGKVKGQKYYKCLLLLSTLRFYSYLQLHTQINTLLHFKMSDNTILYFIFLASLQMMCESTLKVKPWNRIYVGYNYWKAQWGDSFPMKVKVKMQAKGSKGGKVLFFHLETSFFPLVLTKPKIPSQRE